MDTSTAKGNRAAVVSGSSRGIGLAIATELAKRRFDVCLNCSQEAGLHDLESTARKLADTFGVQTHVCAANVAKADEASALMEATVNAFGRIDVLVNNAGITRDGLLARMKEDDFDSVLAVNLKGTFHCCKAAASRMMKQRYGRIINMSSIVGIVGNVGQANYAASKAGVIGFTKSIARELAPRGITVNAVAPGFISTDMTATLSDKQREKTVANIPLGREGCPQDVAHLVAFLASEEAGYITGQVVCVDGGLAL